MSTRHRYVESVKTFLRTLFDFSFSKFITVQMFPALYGLILLADLFAVAYFTFIMFMTSFWQGLIYLFLGAPLSFLAIAAVARALMEFYIVVFRMAENIDEMRLLSEKISGLTATMDGMRDLTRKIPFWSLVSSANKGDEKERKDAKSGREKESEKPRKGKDVNWPY